MNSVFPSFNASVFSLPTMASVIDDAKSKAASLEHVRRPCAAGARTDKIAGRSGQARGAQGLRVQGSVASSATRE